MWSYYFFFLSTLLKQNSLMVMKRSNTTPTACVSAYTVPTLLTRCLRAAGYPGARHASQTRTDTLTWQLWAVKEDHDRRLGGMC